MKLNKKNADGSINGWYLSKEEGYGISVSISNKKFREQIEDGIWPAVECLIDNGHITITSCEGHGVIKYLFGKGIRYNRGPHVTIIGKISIDTLWVLSRPNTTIDMGNNTEHTSLSFRWECILIPNIIKRFLLIRDIKKYFE
jgi:hypothetical protein